MARASATPCPQLHLECENIIIKQRRKRLLPPEPYLVTVKPCTNLKAHPSLDFVLHDEARPIDFSPASDGRRDASSFPGGILTTEGSAGGNSSSPVVLSRISSHSALPISDPDHGEQRPVTVHEFLQDVTRSKPGRKYGRRNRLATVKLDDDGYHDHDQDRGPAGGPIVTALAPTPPSCDLETRNGQRISAYSSSSPTRVQSKRPGPPSRPVLHFRRKKRFAKSLAQRLFEADVFSSGTASSRPTTVTDQNPAHTPSRRPLQFITSLNLTPSLENRIYGKKQPLYGKATSKAASVDSEIQAVSQADDSVPDTLSDGCPAVATSSGKPSSRNWNGATTQTRTRKKIRTGASAAAAAAASTSGKRAFRTRGGKQSSARVPHNPLEYVPLPLVRVETASRIRRTRRPVVRKPQTLHPLHPAQAGHARTHAHAGGVEPISIDVR